MLTLNAVKRKHLRLAEALPVVAAALVVTSAAYRAEDPSPSSRLGIGHTA